MENPAFHNRIAVVIGKLMAATRSDPWPEVLHDYLHDRGLLLGERAAMLATIATETARHEREDRIGPSLPVMLGRELERAGLLAPAALERPVDHQAVAMDVACWWAGLLGPPPLARCETCGNVILDHDDTECEPCRSRAAFAGNVAAAITAALPAGWTMKADAELRWTVTPSTQPSSGWFTFDVMASPDLQWIHVLHGNSDAGTGTFLLQSTTIPADSLRRGIPQSYSLQRCLAGVFENEPNHYGLT